MKAGMTLACSVSKCDGHVSLRKISIGRNGSAHWCRSGWRGSWDGADQSSSNRSSAELRDAQSTEVVHQSRCPQITVCKRCTLHLLNRVC